MKLGSSISDHENRCNILPNSR